MKIVKIIPWASLVMTIGLGVYNFLKNDSFWLASSSQILTLLVAIGITFFVVQRKTDQREAKKRAISVIEKVQGLVDSEIFYRLEHVDGNEGTKTALQQRIQTTNRRINNYINVLEEYGNILSFSNEVKYIKEQFGEYRELVDSYINDFDYLHKSEPRLRKISDNISNKCDRIVIKLYK